MTDPRRRQPGTGTLGVHCLNLRSMKLADGLPPVCQECAKTRNNEP
jgi:hypothetical protein